MAAPIFSGMAAFADNFGRAYGTEKRRLSDEEERKAEREWRDEQRNNQRADRAKADKLNADLADAAAPRTTMQGTVTEAGGNKYLSADPAQAAKMQEMLAAEAEMTGGPAPVQQPGAAITGNMSKGHEIKTGPLDMSAVQKLNSPESIAERQAQAYNNNGRTLEANQMRAGAMDLELKKLGLDKAQAEWGDMEFDRMLKQKIPMGPGFGHAFAKVLTDTNVGGLAGVTYEAVYAPDGKSFEMVGTGPDGAKHSKGKYTDDDAGWAQAMQRANSANLTTKIGYVAEALKAEQSAQKLALEERKVTSTEKRNDAMAIRLMGGGGAGSAQAPGGINMDAIDKTLTGLFSKEDPVTGAKSMDTSGLMVVRSLSLRMPAAVNGDSTGAALQAYNAYSAALTKAGGDSAKAVQLLNAALQSPSAPASAPPAVQAPSPSRGAPAGQAAEASPPAAPAPAPAQPPRKVLSLTDALSGPGADKTLRGFADQKAGEVQALADGVRAAQAAVVQAAQSGNQAAVQTAMQRVAAERARLNQSLAGMNPQQARQVLQAAGLQ